MHVLVTAGNTQAPLDRVRCITNIFSGRTGARIALDALARGYHTHLLTSHPEVVPELAGGMPLPPDRWQVTPYRTFEDLHTLLARLVPGSGYDAVIHSAAVSDYLAGGVFSPAAGTRFVPKEARWDGPQGEPPRLLDRAAGKVKSDEPELWVRLVRAPKLIDQVRGPWGFRGLLVKFKLEVGLADEDLLRVAERSRVHSDADLMVANTLEGAPYWAYVGPLDGGYVRVGRRDLSRRLLDALESLEGRTHG